MGVVVPTSTVNVRGSGTMGTSVVGGLVVLLLGEFMHIHVGNGNDRNSSLLEPGG